MVILIRCEGKGGYGILIGAEFRSRVREYIPRLPGNPKNLLPTGGEAILLCS